MQEGLKVLIVEDEVLISERLKQIVKGFGHDVLGICSSLESVLTFNTDVTPDIAFLDIRMNGVDEGVQVAELMKNRKIPFIYITSFSDKETLQAAVAMGPRGYIVKPFLKNEIGKALELLREELSDSCLKVKSGNTSERIKFDDIRWINSDNVYVEIHCQNKRVVTRMKLNDVEPLLPENKFIRVHQSYLVNTSYVDAYDKSEVRIGSKIIPVSKRYKDNLMHL